VSETERHHPAATAGQIDALMEGLQDALGDDLVGAYLHGSGVLGGFRRDSDIDVVVVSARPTLEEQKRCLIDLLLAISGRRATLRPGRPIELDIVVASEIRPWRYPPAFDFHYDELLRDRFEGGDLSPWASPTSADLASAVTMALRGNRALGGPPPTEVFDPVPRDHYVHAILRDIHTVDEYLPWDTRNVVLTLPRIWSAVATQEVFSKEAAARWARLRLPEQHREVLDRALDAYLGEVEDRWDDIMPRARAYADHVVWEIEHARGPRSTIRS
jgi:predicted nucleotidyltransferase